MYSSSLLQTLAEFSQEDSILFCSGLYLISHTILSFTPLRHALS